MNSNKFYYENGQGEILDEAGNEAMDWEEHFDPFNIASLMKLSQYQKFQRPPEEVLQQLDHEMEEAVEEIQKNKTTIKLLKAAPAGRKAGINVRTAQDWAKRLKEDPNWNIYEKNTNKVNRKESQLQEEHKQHLLEIFEKNPQATKQDAVDSLTEAFEGFNLKKNSVGNFILHDCNLTIKRITLHPVNRNAADNRNERHDWVTSVLKTDMKYLSNCVFVDEAAFNINMRSPFGRSVSGTPAIEVTPLVLLPTLYWERSSLWE
ncbi:hypothetical protein MFLAVUS_007866 [Mucor flavus]|uniref:Transposase n=1 Tax=Mucor flavus TaxID=439312 RepID=A0ABP9Z5G9_9FUNG